MEGLETHPNLPLSVNEGAVRSVTVGCSGKLQDILLPGCLAEGAANSEDDAHSYAPKRSSG
jgi:hypothetical protein